MNKDNTKKIIKELIGEGTIIRCKKCKIGYLVGCDNPKCPHEYITKKERKKLVDKKIQELKELGVFYSKNTFSSHKE